jgi:3-hydroxyisobutyrate dehydrogenase-like beta-hydroxyacid dehydrogenase
MTLKIAFIGFGEVGQLFTEQLSRRPDVEIAVYDVLFDDGLAGADLKRTAARSGAHAAESSAGACQGSHFVISAVTAYSAVTAAREASAALDRSQIYIDLNSVSPSTKRLVGEEAARHGAGFVEFAVMAPVAGPGIAVPILAGGRQAEAVAAALNPLGMSITPASSEIGVASATKLCRSIVIKGMEALMVDLNLAAERAGVMPAVLASLTASYPGIDWADVAKVMPSRVRRHGIRRAAEMREASRMMAEMGLDGSLAQAIAERQERFAQRKDNGVAERESAPQAPVREVARTGSSPRG